MNTKRNIISEVEHMAINAIVHQPDEKAAAEKHFSEAAKKIVQTALQAVDIMEVGEVCRRAVTGAAIQDYDLLAKLLTDPDFDNERLAKAIEALASEKPIDYPPTFCTPVGISKLPSGADGTPPAAAKKRNYLDFDFCGMKLAYFGGKGVDTKFIGKRTNDDPTNPVQIFEITVKRPNAVVGSVAEATENGELLFRLESQVNFNFTKRMAVSCLHRLLDARIKSNRKRHRQIKRKRAAAKAQAGEVA